MEGYDNNTVLEKSIITDIPFLKSSRFKMLMFGAMLLIYGVVFSVLFAKTCVQLSNSMREATALQNDYFNGYSVIEPMHLNLNNYLNQDSDEYLENYNANKENVLDLIDLLKGDNFGVYSNDLATLCENYIEVADTAIEYRKQSNTDQMLSSYYEADNIKNLISMFSTYTSKEIEGIVSSELATINDNMIQQLKIIIFALLIATVIIISAAAIFVHYFLSPIYSLTALVKQVTTESWEIKQVPNTRKDETGLLIRAFYKMLNKIRNQFDELLYKQQLEKDLLAEREKTIRSEALLAKSELRVYQSQINSHFLFNTLNTISRLAYIENAPRVQNATDLVARFLRTTLNQFKNIVTLSEEFSYVNNYLEIQQLRFGNRIQFECDIDGDLEWFKIPSITVQPLVENAFRHGLSEQKNGYIKYAAEKINGSIFIYVWDDGKGIAPEKMQDLMKHLQNDSVEDNMQESIGLLNVYRRLNLCYPGKVTPIIESEYNKFTKIGFMILDSEIQDVS